MGDSEEHSPLPNRHAGRRSDDPKSLLRYSAVRNAVLGTLGLLAATGSFFTWWIARQFAEKDKALSDIQVLQQDMKVVKNEALALRRENSQSFEIAESHRRDQTERWDRFEAKLEAVIRRLGGLSDGMDGVKKSMKDGQPAPPRLVIVCHIDDRGSWPLRVSPDAARLHVQEHFRDYEGGCK